MLREHSICRQICKQFGIISFLNSSLEKAFLFNKLIYKSLSHVSTPCSTPSLLISAWLTTIVSPLSALFWQKNVRESQPACEDCSVPVKKGRAWWWTFSRVFKSLGFKGGFHQANFPNLTNVFVSVIVFPLNLIARVSFVFLWHQKWQNYSDKGCSHFGLHMDTSP